MTEKQLAFLSFLQYRGGRKLRTKIRNMSLKYKITIVYFGVTILLLFISAASITIRYNRAIADRSNQHIEENIRIMSERIETAFKEAKLCSNYLVLNINNIINGNTKQKFNEEIQIKKELNQSVLIFESIESIVFIDKFEKMYTTDIYLTDKKESIQQSSYWKELQKSNGNSILFDRNDSCMEYFGNSEVVTMGKKLNNVISGKLEGYLFVNMKVDYILKTVENEISDYILLDGSDNRLSTKAGNELVTKLNLFNQVKIENQMQTITDKNNVYIVASQPIKDYNWRLIGITNLNKFNISKEEIFAILLVAGCVIVALLSLLVIVAANLITKPLIKLTNGAKELGKGNLELRFDFKTEDEIGTLGNVFNGMIQKIKELIQKVNEEAKKKREYELALIQQQVKPHFLYNTLDIIIMLIDMNRSREAQRVTKRLASYYKNCLSGSEEIISLERELEMIQDYLELQIMRYGEAITYEIMADKKVLHNCIPKMTLQPLVENAIYHGLKYKEQLGHIQITVKEESDKMIIEVMDNGIGMTKEQLANALKLTEETSEHFGVYSVGHRLKLYYGDECQMRMKSEYEKGTTVTIEIPNKRREENND